MSCQAPTDSASQRQSSQSLAYALCEVARGSGYEIDLDDLVSALGYPWLVCAVASEPDARLWPMYARDAFLMEVAKLFGIVVRELHPPETARGLSGAAQFRQHFDASYRPLVERALEHGQAVLAWRGWPGTQEPCWGIVTSTCDGGIGLVGVTRTSENPDERSGPLTLMEPPVQLYVVESAVPHTPRRPQLVERIVESVRSALCGELDERFGLATGVAALDIVIHRLSRNEMDAVAALTIVKPLADGQRLLKKVLTPSTRVAPLLTSAHALAEGCPEMTVENVLSVVRCLRSHAAKLRGARCP